ncbi:flagellar hook-length control protein FliK [mine drainage metagenome]|uniref:Flagellar hook-length control protein FliK n=1 Tax=mine drainage metagenome TaxID=410659 RepID=A0A1J5RN15_9ZZZZ
MLKLPDTAGTNPVARILPMLAIENIGNATQELADRATQFVRGREYVAQVLSKAGESAYNVKVDGEGGKSTLLKMDFGSAAKAGQTVILRYIQDSPVPTFLLTPAQEKSVGSTADISSTAHLIGSYLKVAEESGAPTRYEATAVITQTPANAQVVAHDLKQAVLNSGLFYESHLSKLAQGGDPVVLSIIRQEPQNQVNLPLATLVSQQLTILENQQLSWRGDVWPGQKMDWDVYLRQRNDVTDDDKRQAFGQHQVENDARPISSEMTLHLPRLGKVVVRLDLADSHLRVKILAEQVQALSELKSKSQHLAEAIIGNGQQLDALMVVRHD